MARSYIIYFTLIVCCFYSYAKILNIKISPKLIGAELIFSLIIPNILYFVRLLCQPLVIPTLITTFLIFITFITKIEPGLSITTTVISFGIGFVSYAISSFSVSILFHFVGVPHLSSREITFSAVISLLQLLICYFPWKIRRLKSGMPFLRNIGGGDAGVMASTILLCCIIIANNAGGTKSVSFIFPILLVFVLGLFIFLWWRHRLQKAYIEKIKTRELEALHDALHKEEKRIKQLESNNDYLAKIIHKDNKLIPAMELAVREYLQFSEQNDEAGIQKEGQILLSQLKTISCERAGIITGYQSESKKIPSTDVSQIDMLMNYMYRKANENSIKYDVAISGSIKYMTEKVISVSDLRTLLADLIENAIIAVKASDKKEILVMLSICDGVYVIDVFDSGLPFEPKVLMNFGREKITTHADTGGSGIGLMTVSSILSGYRASFLVEEYPEGSGNFTKKVSVKFDNLNQFNVKSKALENGAIVNRKYSGKTQATQI